MPPLVRPRTGLEAVARGRTQLGHQVIYHLGMGGAHPEALNAWDPATRECDCSGLQAWIAGVPRHVPDIPLYHDFNGGWFETSALVYDFSRPRGIVVGVPRWQDARPGMLLVWGDDPETKHQGHVGLVTAVDSSGPTRVLHCSAGNYRDTGDAIQETDAFLFRAHRALVVRVDWIVCDEKALAA